MQKSGINSNIAKKSNRGFALKMIVCKKVCTRSMIIQKSRLSRMTVTNIVNELIDDGYVIETSASIEKKNKNIPGKKPGILKISDNAPKIIGVYISRTQLIVALSSIDCILKFKENYYWQNETTESIQRKIVDLILVLKNKCKHDILGIGIAAIGPLDARKGFLIKAPSFFGIEFMDIKNLVEMETGLKSQLLNDMDSAALAELMFGRGKNVSDFIYVGLSNGVGAGIIADGQLYQNGFKHSGEIGHMSINYDGPLCVCGNQGCLEVYISMPTFLEKINAVSSDGKYNVEHLSMLYSKSKYRSVFDDMRQKFAIGLTNICNILDPEMIIIGHEGIFFPKAFRKELEEQINQLLFHKANSKIRVLPAGFGENSPLAGGVCSVLQELFTGKEF